MQSDGDRGRKQNNYDEIQRAGSVITKQTADLSWDSGLELVSSYEEAESDRKPVGTPPQGLILYILSLQCFEVKILSRMYHKDTECPFFHDILTYKNIFYMLLIWKRAESAAMFLLLPAGFINSKVNEMIDLRPLIVV